MGFFDLFKLKPRILPVELNVENFVPSVQNSPVPVLIDFYSNTCMPCRQMAKTVTKFASDFNGRVRVGAFDIAQDEEGKILGPLGIRGVPTLVFFNKGEIVEVMTGLSGYLKLEEILKRLETPN